MLYILYLYYPLHANSHNIYINIYRRKKKASPASVFFLIILFGESGEDGYGESGGKRNSG